MYIYFDFLFLRVNRKLAECVRCIFRDYFHIAIARNVTDTPKSHNDNRNDKSDIRGTLRGCILQFVSETAINPESKSNWTLRERNLSQPGFIYLIF